MIMVTVLVVETVWWNQGTNVMDCWEAPQSALSSQLAGTRLLSQENSVIMVIKWVVLRIVKSIQATVA